MSAVGFRIFDEIQRPSPDVLDLFKDVESTHVSDAMHRFGGMDFNIRPASPEMRAVGPAITVRARPGDTLMMFKAMEIARKGDVMVVEYRGYTTVASWGDMLSMTAKISGLSAAVTDGSVRDIEGIKRVGFPVFARDWQCPIGSSKEGPGEINVPISCGGVAVLPGDVIIADANGVSVVPRQDAEAVARKAMSIAADERRKTKEMEQGNLDLKWVNQVLQQKGVLPGSQ